MAVNLIEWLPDALKDFYEFQKKFEAENPEFDFLYDIWVKWRENLFPRTADADGIARFEDLLNIKPLPGDTIEDRRFRVIAKLNSRLPYTEIQLRKILASILGWDNYEMKIEGLELWLWTSISSHSQFRTLLDTLLEIVPENILFRVINRLRSHVQLYLATFGTTRHIVQTHTKRRTQDIMLAGTGRFRKIVETRQERPPMETQLAALGRNRKIVRTQTEKRPQQIRVIDSGIVRKVVKTQTEYKHPLETDLATAGKNKKIIRTQTEKQAQRIRLIDTGITRKIVRTQSKRTKMFYTSSGGRLKKQVTTGNN